MCTTREKISSFATFIFGKHQDVSSVVRIIIVSKITIAAKISRQVHNDCGHGHEGNGTWCHK
jgi:hypothetical protein